MPPPGDISKIRPGFCPNPPNFSRAKDTAGPPPRVWRALSKSVFRLRTPCCREASQIAPMIPGGESIRLRRLGTVGISPFQLNSDSFAHILLCVSYHIFIPVAIPISARFSRRSNSRRRKQSRHQSGIRPFGAGSDCVTGYRSSAFFCGHNSRYRYARKSPSSAPPPC